MGSGCTRGRVRPEQEPLTQEELATVKSLLNKGFTVKQLLLFYEEHESSGQLNRHTTTNDVVKSIVLPETEAQRCCYMESDFMKECGGPQRASKLVSHAWNSKFRNTLLNILLDACGGRSTLLSECCRDGKDVLTFSCKQAMNNLPDATLDSTYWLCIFAINEHTSICGDCRDCRERDGGVWGAELLAADQCKTCGQPKRNPCPCGTPKLMPGDPRYEIDKFGEVVGLVREIVVSLDPGLVTLSRVWVVREIGSALSGKPVRFRLAEDLEPEMLEKLWEGKAIATPVEKCHATSPKDRDMILSDIKRQPGGYAAFDEFISCMIELNLGHCGRLRRISGAALQALPNIVQLEMKLDWCKAILSDLSRLGLGQGLLGQLRSLRSLTMDFSFCRLLRDVEPLAAELRALTRLSALRLSFHWCEALVDLGGLQSLGHLQELQTLELNFAACEGLVEADVLRCLGSMRELQTLDLDFTFCTGLSKVGLLAEGIGQLRQLQLLNLDLRGCWCLEDVSGLLCFGQMAQLQKLKVSLTDTQVHYMEIGRLEEAWLMSGAEVQVTMSWLGSTIRGWERKLTSKKPTLLSTSGRSQGSSPGGQNSDRKLTNKLSISSVSTLNYAAEVPPSPQSSDGWNGAADRKPTFGLSQLQMPPDGLPGAADRKPTAGPNQLQPLSPSGSSSRKLRASSMASSRKPTAVSMAPTVQEEGEEEEEELA